MTLDELHELARRDPVAGWLAALAWRREDRTPELEWPHEHYVWIPETAKHLTLLLEHWPKTHLRSEGRST